MPVCNIQQGGPPFPPCGVKIEKNEDGGVSPCPIVEIKGEEGEGGPFLSCDVDIKGNEGGVVFPHPGVEIKKSTGGGGSFPPPGVEMRVEGFFLVLWLKSREDRRGPYPPEPPPHVKIKGTMCGGGLALLH